MSEQTPNSSGDLNGTEPSMEDILASIRKIISDDEPVAMESPEDIPAVKLVDSAAPDGLDDLMQGLHMEPNDLTSDAVLDAAVVQSASFTPEMESVDLNIDDVLASLDEEALLSDADGIPVVDDASDDALSAIMEDFEPEPLSAESFLPTESIIEADGIVPDAEDDILSFLDNDIPLPEAMSLEAAHAVPDVVAPSAAISSFGREDDAAVDDLEMGALLDDILMTPVDAAPEDALEDSPVERAKSAEDSDLELVKSLMADLADDPDGFETDEDLDALLAIPDVEEAALDDGDMGLDVEGLDVEGLVAEVQADLAADAEEDASEFEDDALFEELMMGEPETDVELEAVADAEPEAEEDILGDILDMTLEDELESHPDDFTSLDEVLEAEQDNLAENAVEIEDISEDMSPDDFYADDLPSLSEIAAAAEADAVAVEMAKAPPAIAGTAGLAIVAGGAALGTTALGTTPAEPETETAETYSETDAEIPTTEIPSEPTPNQETSMPVKAVKTDAILDEVTETATAGAFAELNQVVEDKAIFNERGPRIGDLVQEALRPMLKEWLDANLKGIVERAVAKEVKRISTGK